MKSVVFFITISTMFFIAEVHGLKCFQCTSKDDPECATLTRNDTQSVYLKECAPSMKFCRKLTQTIVDKLNHHVRVTRDCGWIPYKTDADNCYENDDDFKYEHSCQCYTDACNSSMMQISSIIITTFLSFVLFIIH